MADDVHVRAARLWRRLDVDGHDACRLYGTDAGWTLEGTATFMGDDAPACLRYEVEVDHSWITLGGWVRGWSGDRQMEMEAKRSAAGAWSLNGSVRQGLERCVDLDLGFTPATNLLQLRRLDLLPGQAADVPVAWLDVFGGTLEVLHQRYACRTPGALFYEAPRFSYAALLEVDDERFVTTYPGLWTMVPAGRDRGSAGG